MKNSTRLRSWLAVLAALAGATGCFSRGKEGANPPATAHGPATTRYKVVADSTPLYKYGPQQLNGPDLSLKKDTELTMIKRRFGYSEVSTSDGQTGFVGTEDITQLTAEDIAAENATLQQMAQAEAAIRAGNNNRSNAIVGEYTIPPEAGNQERLPVADPSPGPRPSPAAPFRY